MFTVLYRAHLYYAMLCLTISAGMESYLTGNMYDILPTGGYFITVITTLVRKV
jgi:hypothetical protein